MKRRLLEILVCPWCGGGFEVIPLGEPSPGGDVEEGALRCACGRAFPIIRGIPRILDKVFDEFPEFARRHPEAAARPVSAATVDETDEAIRRTSDSFGYQWTTFADMATDFRENFLQYIYPVDTSFFPGKLGLDMGCGFGRHIYNAAKFGAEMVGVDLSEAIESTRRNTLGMPNVHLVQADVYHLPFRPATFDFVYSIGVLHHLPDPEAGFRAIVRLVRQGGAAFIWVYSKSRSVVNALLEAARPITTRLPRRLQKLLSLGGATVDWVGFIVPYRVASRMPGLGGLVERMMFERIKVYSHYPFQVVYADWFDRLAAPIRFYYDEQDMRQWLQRAELSRTVVSPTGLYGWRAYGERL